VDADGEPELDSGEQQGVWVHQVSPAQAPPADGPRRRCSSTDLT